MNLRWTDERLAEALKSLDPAQTAHDAATTSADWTRLRSVMAAGNRRARTPLVFRLRALWAVPVMAAAVVIALGIGSGSAPPAYAQTPPPLSPAPITRTIDSVIAESVEILLEAPQPAAQRQGQLVRWRNSHDASNRPVIVPERYTWAWDESGVGSLKVTAEEPYSVLADGQLTDPAGPAPTAGTKVNTAAADEHFGGFPTAPPSDAAGLASALRARVPMPDTPDAVAYWGAITMLLNEWTLTPAHHAAMLQLLEEAGGVELLGTATDRLGRAGVAIRLKSPTTPAFEVTIVLDADTRQIIASDVIYAGGLDIIDEPVGSVVEYSAWIQRSD